MNEGENVNKNMWRTIALLLGTFVVGLGCFYTSVDDLFAILILFGAIIVFFGLENPFKWFE